MPHFNSYDPSAWGWTYGAGSVPFTNRGVPFPQGVANDDVAVIFAAALDLIVPDMREPLGLHADCWGYEARDVRNSPGVKSFHGYGLAVDVNATTNGQTTQPMSTTTTTLPLDTGSRVHPLGIEWGGDWTADSPRDPMHLELHLDPGEAAALAAKLRAKPAPTPIPLPEDTDMPVVIYTTDATGKPQNPAWFLGDGTRTRAMGPAQWTLANHLAKAGACHLIPVSDADYNATTVRAQ